MRFLLLATTLAFVSACSSDERPTPCSACGESDVDMPPTDTYALAFDFTRDPAADPSPFSVQVAVTLNGAPLRGAKLTAVVDRASVGPVKDLLNGTYSFGVTPQGAGEHLITVTYAGQTYTRTALVMPHVDAAFGQPLMVEGLVNTPGYEDGANVTADGDYLFVQYGPVYFSGLLLYAADRANGGCGGDRLNPTVCHHPWIDSTIGPFAAPARPGFFTGRINTTNGTMRHNSNLYEIADGGAPIIAPPTMFYGFHRQADGSYAEPFYVAFDDANDAIVNPFGFTTVRNSGGLLTAAWSLQDATVNNFDVYALDITPGTPQRLGGYEPNPTAPPRSASYPATRLTFDDTTGTQGNPMLAPQTDGNVWAVFTDDEYDHTDADADNISAFVLTGGTVTSGTWTKVILPTAVNTTTSAETQPFMDTDGYLYFRRDSDLLRVLYSGPKTAAGLASAANWGIASVVIRHSITQVVNDVVVIGEPSVAVVGGVRQLYFVYGRIRAVGDVSGLPDIDMQVGVLPLKN